MDVDLAIVGDAAYVLNAMLPMIEEKKHPDWMKMIHEWQAQDYHPVSDASRLMPHQVIGEVCNQCGPEAVYVTDVGQHQMWAAQYIRHTKSRGFITSGASAPWASVTAQPSAHRWRWAATSGWSCSPATAPST